SLIDVDIPAMKYYTGQAANLAGKPCFVSRTGYTGEDGCEITVDAADGSLAWEVILGAGNAYGAKPAGLGARDTLRLESAMPLYGHELSESINPVEAGLGFGYNLKDREFIGKDAIAKFEAETTFP